MINTITLLGSSSGRNAGDAALIAAIMDNIDQSCQKRMRYNIPSIKPAFIRNTYGNDVHPVGMMPWNLSLKMLGLPTYQSILNSDLSLIFDAILFDRSLFNPLFNYLSSVYLLLGRAKKRGKLLGMYNVGTGPVDTAAGRHMLKELSEMMDFITVRDQSSLELLHKLGVTNKNIFLAADAALTMSAAPSSRANEILQELGLNDASEILAVNVNAYLDSWASPGRKAMSREHFTTVYAQALNQILPQIKAPLMLVVTQHHDLSLNQELLKKVDPAHKMALLSNTQYSPFEIRAVLERASLLFGMRLHSVILASAGLTPVSAIAYQPKVRHYLDELGLSQFVFSFDDYQPQALATHLLRSWEAKKDIKAQLSKVIPVLRQRAMLAANIVAGLHQGVKPDFSSAANQLLDSRKSATASSGIPSGVA